MISIGKKSIFYIDSQNAISNKNTTTSATHFTVPVDMPPNNNYDRIVVLQACIPKSYYLIQEGYNSFVLGEQDLTMINTASTITIPPGNYSKNGFIIALTSALNTASRHHYIYSISYPASSETNTGKFTFKVSLNNLPLDVSKMPSFVFGVNSNITLQMGFSKGKTYNFSGSSLTSQNVIKLQSKDTIFLKSSSVSSSTGAVLQEIYSSVPDFSDIIFNQNCLELNSKELTSKSNNFTFTLTDEDDTPLDLNGQNCVFSICCYEANNSLELMKADILLKNIEKLIIS